MAKHEPYYVTLGLEAAPQDRKEVKRAYSRQLKQTRPEDDPEGFMRLRDAHDTALAMLEHAAQKAEWEAVQEAAPASTDEVSPNEVVDPELNTRSLTYGDMIPDVPVEPSPTSYSIGPTPSLEAPVQFNTAPKPNVPQAPALQKDIEDLLDTPDNYNDRDKWNQLFRTARQLDIDDYVDFEDLLMNAILRFHGYYDQDTPHFDQPEKLPQKLSPSLSASLFKTMSWDEVSQMSYQKSNQIEWLNRRMRLTRQDTPTFESNMPPPSAPTALGRWFWPALGLLIALAIFADFLT